jgi:ribose/xylose/arabinose/galactoside ABC-type transport system permease subunit
MAKLENTAALVDGPPEPAHASRADALRGFAARARATAYRTGGLFIGLIIVGAVFQASNSAFLTSGNLLSILRYTSTLAIMALGLATIMIVGEIDISFGFAYGFVSTITAVAWITWGWSMYTAMLLGLVVAVGIAGFNALFTLVFNIPSLVVTLGSGALIYGLTLYVGNSASWNPAFPPAGAHISKSELAVFNGLTDTHFDVPLQIWWMLGFAIVFGYLLHGSLFGFRLSAIGGNPEAARLGRLPVRRYKLIAFLICTLMAAVAGLLDFSFISSVEPNAGQGFLFPVFTAVIIGGASLSGGKGSVVGTITAALLLASLSIGLALIAAGSFAQQVFLGGVTILAVALDQITQRKKRPAA